MEGDVAPVLPTCRPPRCRAPDWTVRSLIKDAAQDNTLLYLSLLPPELRDRLDELVRASAWHFEPKLTSVYAPRAHFTFNWHLAVLESDERVIAWTSEQPPGKMVRTP